MAKACHNVVWHAAAGLWTKLLLRWLGDLTEDLTSVVNFSSTLSSTWSRGVMVSTLDSESSDPSSNLGGTWGISFS